MRHDGKHTPATTLVGAPPLQRGVGPVGISTNQIEEKSHLVSIVCVTYNAAATLPDLLDSVTKHKTNEVELAVIDGGSTDGTLEILKASPEVIDFWLSRPDNGIYDAMNNSLGYITGKWVIFLGADDVLLDGFTEMLKQLREPQTIYYGNLLFYGKEFLKVYDDYYLTKLNICQQAIFYPRAVFEKYQFDLKYKVYADYHLNLRCWNDPGLKFSHLPYLVSDFRAGGYSSHEKDPAFEQDRDMLFKKYLKRGSYYRYLNRTYGAFGLLRRLIQNK